MMAKRACTRRRKMLSSGRLTGTTKMTCNGKQVAVRKTAHSDVESGCSLYSKDSEDQVETIHYGLDHCAALLKDILQNEVERIETVHQKTGKASSVKTTSRPLLNKVKRGAKKTTLSTHVHKEIVPVSNRKPASVSKTAVEEDRTPLNTEQPLVQPVPASFTQCSPVIHQKLCKHVQTQVSLQNIQPLQISTGIPEVPLCLIPENGCQPVAAFGYHRPTSTPALSPQYTANPSVVPSGISMDSCSQCAPQMEPGLAPAGFSASASVAKVQPVPICSAQPLLLQTTLNNPTKSTVLAAPGNREAISDQGSQDRKLKETDLIRRMHLALLHVHEKENKRGKANGKCQTVDPIQAQSSDSQGETAEEHSEDTLSKQEGVDGGDMAPVRDTGCQTSFDKADLKPQRGSLQETATKIKTVKYFLRELKALLIDHDDSEILRLLREVEDCISFLPAAVDSSNAEAEIALALQPLRSENAQLRRQLRILNQQLKEQKRAAKDCNRDGDIDFISLQSLNRTLQSQMNESMKSIESLQNKNEELIKILESQREEEKRLTRIIHEREQELLEKKQQNDVELTKLKMEADEMLANMKSFQYKVEAAEKENRIMSITLRQRDAEVGRLRELTRALQGSMSKLLSDLTMDTKPPKPGKSLSKALLEIHEKQLQGDMYPLSAFVMSYLQNVEIDQVNTEPLSKGETKEADQTDDRAAEHSPQKSPLVPQAVPAPANPFAFLKPDVEAASDLSTLVGGDKLDETIYIPLTSSPSKRLAVAAERCGMSLQDPKNHDFGLADSKQLSRFGVLDEAKVFDKFSGSCTLKKTVENKPENMWRTATLESTRPQTQPKEITNRAAKEILDNPGRLQPDKFFYTPISHCKGNVQKKGIGISAPDSSFSTFDCLSKKSEWTISSFSTFTSQDEEDFKNGLAALDANIARLQKTLQNNLTK
ncbi:coiled-coil domain-containing protein 14 [Heteronotia binoei]|uniref:coiled-coil domain-containing protein 14 n=1 Tax=Heteronotia binoei TaxID=13085 RepID=UPI00292DA051|nr:coiled-coil domain-containing protein 14 [Heteronotia binoei]